MNVTFDKHSLIIDGKREFIISGAFHYFRTPSPELAKDRFMKMKAGGYNTVEIYFWWKYHSEKQGEYDFTGLKDIEKVLEMAREVGLYVICRPGPFINSEVNAGGFPLWLLKDKDVIPRNRIGTEYHYSEKYMEYITEISYNENTTHRPFYGLLHIVGVIRDNECGRHGQHLSFQVA